MNYKFCACSQIQTIGTHPSGKKALIILSPSGLIASSGIRWKSSRLSKARTQEVHMKLKSEEKLLKKNSQQNIRWVLFLQPDTWWFLKFYSLNHVFSKANGTKQSKRQCQACITLQASSVHLSR